MREPRLGWMDGCKRSVSDLLVTFSVPSLGIKHALVNSCLGSLACIILS